MKFSDWDGRSRPQGVYPASMRNERDAAPRERSDFVREMVREDLRDGKYHEVVTRFPPEPNGYLHIGHAKSVVLNFGVAEEFGGRCHLRFDDTNPETEEEEYAQSIMRDIRWLGYDWGEHLYHASDYFERFYGYAVELVEKGLAYVDSQSEEEIRESRGTVTEPGRDSPYRNRSVDENLDLLGRMRAGEFPNGAHVLRAKIDMSSPNMKMRDPLLYRIRNAAHYRTGDEWHIYPMYDFAHCLEDAIESVTHSLCTLEFENNRDIYDWVLENVSVPKPRPFQTEFARLSLTYTVMSKRKLLALVKNGRVSGWDDPRMPTLAGMRRRGFTPKAIRSFCEQVGVAKTNATVEVERLEHAVRDDLNTKAPRMMGVLRPLKLVVESWPADEVEWLDAPLWPHDVPKEGSRKLPFGRNLFIERDDFSKEPPPGFRRLSPGAEVRLRHAYIVRCTDVVEDEEGRILEVRAVHEPKSSSKSGKSGRKAKGTIHWVCADKSVEIPVRLYDRLFTEAYPEADPERSFEEYLNPASLETLAARCEPALGELTGGDHIQLERQGFFVADPVDAKDGFLVLNRTVPLRDSWARQSTKSEAGTRKETRQAESNDSKEKGVGGARRAKAPRKRAKDDSSRERAALSPQAATLRDEHGLGDEQARVLASRPELLRFFHAALGGGASPRSVARWVVNELAALAKDRGIEGLAFGPKDLGELARLVDEGVMNLRAARIVLEEMALRKESPLEVFQRLGLQGAVDETTLDSAVREVLEAFPEELARYRDGKKGLLGFFLGRLMEKLGKGADPKKTREVLGRHLDP